MLLAVHPFKLFCPGCLVSNYRIVLHKTGYRFLCKECGFRSAPYQDKMTLFRWVEVMADKRQDEGYKIREGRPDES